MHKIAAGLGIGIKFQLLHIFVRLTSYSTGNAAQIIDI